MRLPEVQAPLYLSILLDVFVHQPLLGGRLSDCLAVAAGADFRCRDSGPVAVLIEEMTSVARNSDVAPMKHMVEINRLRVLCVQQAGQNVSTKKVERHKTGQE